MQEVPKTTTCPNCGKRCGHARPIDDGFFCGRCDLRFFLPDRQGHRRWPSKMFFNGEQQVIDDLYKRGAHRKLHDFIFSPPVVHQLQRMHVTPEALAAWYGWAHRTFP